MRNDAANQFAMLRRRGCALYLLLLLLLQIQLAESKAISGDFRLSGLKSEYVLSTFSVMPSGGRVKLHLVSHGMYEDESHLKFRLYRDVEWPAYLQATTCMDRIKHAKITQNVSFVKDLEDDKYKATVNVMLFNSPDDGAKPRSHYWYFVLDDCSLEEYFQDNKVPLMHYDLLLFNHLSSSGQDLSHLSADEHDMTTLHTVCLLVSGGVAALLLFLIVLSATAGKNQSIHAAVLWVAASAGLDACSSFFEIMHLQIYKANGVGSYFIDAMSAHAEAICDSMLVILLLSIASGWTLPSDVIAVNAATANHFQRLLREMGRPMANLRHFNAAGLLAIFITVAHIVLAQLGRTFNEDFNSYHQFEHWPGRTLMGMRVILGFLFALTTIQTRIRCKAKQLRAFYKKLGILGFIWFQSLPLLTMGVNIFMPYHVRHPTISIGTALMQSSSIMLFAWLVTAHSSTYHSLSHLSAPSDKSLTEQMRMPHGEDSRTWKIGKAKVCLD
ncbi:hypothetical protein MPSEU_000788300 [Mayamaea pseudoterrestris]|nr:hypothetical protein MPSEU_000788300 [Mayamaea pseudoterrestris]